MDATNVGPPTPPPPLPPTPPGSPRYSGPRQLRRLPDQGPIGGVCAGVADYFGVDPVIVRIAAVVLALSGPGIIAYILAWIFVPPADGPSGGTPWLHRHDPHRDRGAQVFGILLLVVAVSILWGGWWSPVRKWMFPLALIAVGAWLLLRRDGDDGSTVLDPPQPPMPPVPPGPPADDTTDDTVDGMEGETVGATAPDDTLIAPPAPPPPPWGHHDRRGGPPWGGPPWRGWHEEAPPEIVAARRRRRLVFPIVLGALLVWVGLAFLAGVSVETGLAIALCIVGVGFVLGAFVGGSRGLIIPAFLIASALVLTTALNLPLNGPIGERSWTPETLAALDSHYELSMGEGRLDLTELPLADGDVVHVRATIGMGHLVVIVPDDVRLDVSAESSAGDIVLLGNSESGLGVSTDRTIDPEERDVTLDLDLEVGLGQIEVIARRSFAEREQPSTTSTTVLG